MTSPGAQARGARGGREAGKVATLRVGGSVIRPGKEGGCRKVLRAAACASALSPGLVRDGLGNPSAIAPSFAIAEGFFWACFTQLT